MKRRSTLTWLIALSLLSPIALAKEEKPQPKTQSKSVTVKRSSNTTDGKTTGKVVIEIDGQREEIEIDGDKPGRQGEANEALKRAMQELPAHIRKQIEAVQKGQVNLNGLRVQTRSIVIGPDGKVHEFKGGDGPKQMMKNLPKEVREQLEKARKAMKKAQGQAKAAFTGKAVIIGPDGERVEFDLAPENLPLQLEGIRGENLDGINEVLRKQLQQAMKHAKQFGGAQPRNVAPNAGKPDKTARPAQANDAAAAISSKLDQILRRLDRMDKQIKELQKKVDG